MFPGSLLVGLIAVVAVVQWLAHLPYTLTLPGSSLGGDTAPASWGTQCAPRAGPMDNCEGCVRRSIRCKICARPNIAKVTSRDIRTHPKESFGDWVSQSNYCV